jgi:hypothetical protein
MFCHECVATLVFGLRPRQKVVRFGAKRETQESHHMLPRVQRVWGNEPSHSQVNSHVGSWSPKWILESSEHNCRGQNPSTWRILYIIQKLLKCKCLKWAHITHLDIWSTSYDQEKGQESNGTDLISSRAGNVRHIVGELSTRVTTLLETSLQLEVCTRSYVPPKLRESQLWEFQDSHLGVPKQKAIWMWPPWRGTKYIIRGKVVVSPKSGPWWILCVRVARGSS